MEVIELDALTPMQWREMIAGEEHPWGAVGEQLCWSDKDLYLALRDHGRLVAVAGAGRADVATEGGEGFAVVGIGGVFVTRPARGRGLARRLLEPLLSVAAQMGPERAMLFCRPQLVALYRKLAFVEIAAPIWAQQPGGTIEMPMRGMWRPLSAHATWPPGRVDVLGLPF